MLSVDSHCHVSDVWYEPAEVLLHQMDRCGVQHAVLIQMLGQYHNDYQQGCAKTWPDRFVSVVAVDPARAEAVAELEELAGDGAKGVRLRPISRSPGEDPLAIWRAAAALGLTVSCVGTTSQFTASGFMEVIAAFPGLPIVLEHLGGVARPDADESVRNVWDLARAANIFLKVPGLGQLAKRSPSLPAQGSPLDGASQGPLLKALEAFTARRLMWGSDFPVVSTREGYAQALHGPKALLCDLSESDRDQLFGGLARRLFQISS